MGPVRPPLEAAEPLGSEMKAPPHHLQAVPAAEPDAQAQGSIHHTSRPFTEPPSQSANTAIDTSKLWWRKLQPALTSALAITPTKAAFLAGVQLTISGKAILALLDTGATNSFVTPRTVDAFALHTIPTQASIEMVVASGEKIVVQAKAPQVKFQVGRFHSSAELLVATVPYAVILGADWLHSTRAIWDFGNGKLTLFNKEWRFSVSTTEINIEDLHSNLSEAEVDAERQQARTAHAQSWP